MIKLALKTSSWSPTPEQWLKAANTVNTIERKRIAEFMFKRDAKQSLAGRLMIRSTLAKLTSLLPQSFVLDREKSGRPYLVNPPDSLSTFRFNVSHAGDYAAFVGSLNSSNVGIDIMKVELRRNTDLETFFGHMKNQFTNFEWSTIRGAPSKKEQLLNFYRHWCLKESFVKGIGTGLKFGLQRIEFRVGDFVDDACATTQVYVDGCLEPDYQFQEHVIDNHIMTIALTPPCKTVDNEKPRVIQFEDLIVNEVPYQENQYFYEFNRKQELPGL